jgi:hypothetical protein
MTYQTNLAPRPPLTAHLPAPWGAALALGLVRLAIQTGRPRSLPAPVIIEQFLPSSRDILAANTRILEHSRGCGKDPWSMGYLGLALAPGPVATARVVEVVNFLHQDPETKLIRFAYARLPGSLGWALDEVQLINREAA